MVEYLDDMLDPSAATADEEQAAVQPIMDAPKEAAAAAVKKGSKRETFTE